VRFGGFEKAQRLGPNEATDFSVIGDPQLNQPGDVAAKKFLVDGVLQGSTQDSEHVADRARRQHVLATLRFLLRAARRRFSVRVFALNATLAPRPQLVQPKPNLGRL
jgi:hypothetical protein